MANWLVKYAHLFAAAWLGFCLGFMGYTVTGWEYWATFIPTTTLFLVKAYLDTERR